MTPEQWESSVVGGKKYRLVVRETEEPVSFCATLQDARATVLPGEDVQVFFDGDYRTVFHCLDFRERHADFKWKATDDEAKG